jgi:hypothetical protein
MKRTLLALAATAALLSPIAGQAPLAQADAPQDSCGITAVDVTVNRFGTQLNPHYDYWWGCADNPLPYHQEHYVGDWDPSGRMAQVSQSLAGTTGISTWLCDSNPWDIDYGPPAGCALSSGSTGSGQTNFPIGPLLTSEKHALHAQLQNAIKQAQATPTIPSNLLIRGSKEVLPKLDDSPAQTVPAQPDLQLVDIHAESSAPLGDGMTAVYDVSIGNNGTKLPAGSQIQLQIQASGSVQFYSMAQTPAGWTCSSASPVVCAGPIGGYGDPTAATIVTFRVQVHGNKTGGVSGLGSLSAAADPNNLVKESDESNNAQTLAITVR